MRFRFRLSTLLVSSFVAAILLYWNVLEEPRSFHLQFLYQGWPFAFRVRELIGRKDTWFNPEMILADIAVGAAVVVAVGYFLERKWR